MVQGCKIKLWIWVIPFIFSCNDNEVVVNKYPNGNIKEEIPMKNKFKNGKAKYYNENGKLEYEIEYKNDTAVGIMKEYYNNGNILREIDLASLRTKVYKENGKSFLLGKLTNREMLMNGIWEEWLIQENYKRFEWQFEDSKLNGPYRAFYESGSIELEGFYKNGTLDSTLTYYDEKGNKIKEELWKAKDDYTSSSLVKTIEY